MKIYYETDPRWSRKNWAHTLKMRDLKPLFLYIKIAAISRFACFTTILGTYQIIICTLSTLLERVHLPIMKPRKRKKNYPPYVWQYIDFS